MLKGKLEGFGWYTYETISRLVNRHPEIEFYFFFDRPFDTKFVFADNVHPVVLYPPARHPILFRIWFDFSVTRALKKYAIDLFISPDGYLSMRTNVPQVSVIHDLNFEHFPNDLPKSASRYLRKFFPKFAEKAAHILTVSEFSKEDIRTTYGIASDKITVGYNGASAIFTPVSSEVKERVKLKYTASNEFFLFVGALHPRKNLKRLLKAYDDFIEQTGSETHLLIVGAAYYWSEEMKAALNVMQNKEKVVFSGHVDIHELRDIYGSARALAFVSYFEGFGIPIVEAMQCNCPVLVAENTACHEVAGEAALLCDPFSETSITESLKRLENDEKLREQLIASGKSRCQEFSWDTTAHKMEEVMMNLLTPH